MILSIAFFIIALVSTLEAINWKGKVSSRFHIYLVLITLTFYSLSFYFFYGVEWVLIASVITTAAWKVHLIWHHRKSLKNGSIYSDELIYIIGLLSSKISEIEIDHTAIKASNMANKSRGVLVIGFDETIKYVNDEFASYFDKSKKWFLDNKYYPDMISEPEYHRSNEFWHNNLEENKTGFVNTWEVDGKKVKLKWVDIFNDNDTEVSYCVCEVYEV
jgi:hypothetical protein